MLITGGLIVIGVLILVAAFFIGRSDNATSQANRIAPTTSAVTPEQVPTAPTVPVTVTAPAPRPAQASQAPETQPLLMNGQIHELAGQIQKLQEQSQELARRLELLNTMVKRVEESEAASADK